MTDLVFEIVKNELIANDIYEMTLKTDRLPQIFEGQFANVKIANRKD